MLGHENSSPCLAPGRVGRYLDAPAPSEQGWPEKASAKSSPIHKMKAVAQSGEPWPGKPEALGFIPHAARKKASRPLCTHLGPLNTSQCKDTHTDDIDFLNVFIFKQFELIISFLRERSSQKSAYSNLTHNFLELRSESVSLILFHSLPLLFLGFFIGKDSIYLKFIVVKTLLLGEEKKNYFRSDLIQYVIQMTTGLQPLFCHL